MGRTKAFVEEEVLDKAIDLFWCKGYNAASMQEIVDHLGISRSSLYDTFGDKKALFMAALQQYRRKAGNNLKKIVNQADPVLPALRDFFETMVEESVTDTASKGCFVVNTAAELASQDASIASLVEENRQKVEQVFFELIEKGKASGEITNTQSSQALAHFLYNTMTGIKVAAKACMRESVYQDILEVTFSVFQVRN
ncbi:MAG: TetR/AcrR family transcriptional regulator [Thermonemataceae bacterium]